MKLRFLTAVAAVAMLAACADDETCHHDGGQFGETSRCGSDSPEHFGHCQGLAGLILSLMLAIVCFFAYDKSDLSAEARAQLGKWVTFPEDLSTRQP